MPIVLTKTQLQKSLPEAQLKKEQEDKYSQPRPIVWRRAVSLDKGIHTPERKK